MRGQVGQCETNAILFAQQPRAFDVGVEHGVEGRGFRRLHFLLDVKNLQIPRNAGEGFGRLNEEAAVRTINTANGAHRLKQRAVTYQVLEEGRLANTVAADETEAAVASLLVE